MIKLIGGPLHGHEMNVDSQSLIVPVYSSDGRAPVEDRHSGKTTQCIYEWRKYRDKDGDIKEALFFVEGYYPPESPAPLEDHFLTAEEFARNVNRMAKTITVDGFTADDWNKEIKESEIRPLPSPLIWFSVEDKLPDYDDFVWVKRSGKEAAELAYYSNCENKNYRFQDPYTVGDNEGLSVEYYTDVTHWAELQAPAVNF